MNRPNRPSAFASGHRWIAAAARFLLRIARGIARRIRAAARAVAARLRIVEPGDHFLSPFAPGPRRLLWHLVYDWPRRGAATAASSPPGHLRVLLCVPWFDRGGSSVHLANVFQRLVGQGVSVTAVATNPERDAHLTNGQDIYRSFTRDCFCLSACVATRDRARFLAYLVRTRGPDVVLLVGSRLTYESLAELRAIRPQLRVIDHLYNTEGHVGNNREFAALIDFNIVASEAVHEKLLDLGERSDRVEVIHHGIDSDEFSPKAVARPVGAPPGGYFTFGFLGRFSEEKRPEHMIELARRLPDCRFVLAGTGAMLPSLREAVRAAGLDDRVRLPGPVSSPLDLYRMVDAIVIPSRIEGLPLVLLEAMAAGKPVIAARVGMIGSVIDSGVNGFTYPTGDLDALEQVARRLLRFDKAAQARVGELARQTVLERFALAGCAENYRRTFARVVASLRQKETEKWPEAA
jgi:glycosyltransferase involved in cell wall biosynthesis